MSKKPGRIDRFDLHAGAASRIFKPGHQQVTPAAAVFEDVASEFRGDGRDHNHLRCPK